MNRITYLAAIAALATLSNTAHAAAEPISYYPDPVTLSDGTAGFAACNSGYELVAGECVKITQQVSWWGQYWPYVVGIAILLVLAYPLYRLGKWALGRYQKGWSAYLSRCRHAAHLAVVDGMNRYKDDQGDKSAKEAFSDFQHALHEMADERDNWDRITDVIAANVALRKHAPDEVVSLRRFGFMPRADRRLRYFFCWAPIQRLLRKQRRNQGQATA